MKEKNTINYLLLFYTLFKKRKNHNHYSKNNKTVENYLYYRANVAGIYDNNVDDHDDDSGCSNNSSRNIILRIFCILLV